MTDGDHRYLPAFPVAVCGSGDAPPELVAAVLDRLVGPKLDTRRPVLIVRGGEGPAGDWAARVNGASVTIEPVCRELYGRAAHARWALAVAAVAQAVVVFGDDRPWWRLLRLARELNIPVRRVAIPPAYTPPRERPVPAAIIPAADPWAVLDGAGPGGYPD